LKNNKKYFEIMKLMNKIFEYYEQIKNRYQKLTNTQKKYLKDVLFFILILISYELKPELTLACSVSVLCFHFIINIIQKMCTIHKSLDAAIQKILNFTRKFKDSPYYYPLFTVSFALFLPLYLISTALKTVEFILSYSSALTSWLISPLKILKEAFDNRRGIGWTIFLQFAKIFDPQGYIVKICDTEQKTREFLSNNQCSITWSTLNALLDEKRDPQIITLWIEAGADLFPQSSHHPEQDANTLIEKAENQNLEALKNLIKENFQKVMRFKESAKRRDTTICEKNTTYLQNLLKRDSTMFTEEEKQQLTQMWAQRENIHHIIAKGSQNKEEVIKLPDDLTKKVLTFLDFKQPACLKGVARTNIPS
jgi:hypothetical protein